MGYCTSADIIAIIANDDLIQLTNDSGGSSVDTDKITDAISYVDNLIDGYIRGKYDLPLSSNPDELNNIAVDLTVYRLYCRRMYTDLPEGVYRKRNDAMQVLKDIQNGKYSLGIESTDGYANHTFKTNKTSSSKKYTSTKWGQYDWL